MFEAVDAIMLHPGSEKEKEYLSYLLKKYKKKTYEKQ